MVNYIKRQCLHSLFGQCLKYQNYSNWLHSCEKLKHHFFEESFQSERKGCSGAAVALVAARRLYLIILRFVEFFWLSCGGGTPTSDNFQKSKEKNWENLHFFEGVAMQWANLKFMSEVHLWLSFGYLFELAVSDENYSLLCTPKV